MLQRILLTTLGALLLVSPLSVPAGPLPGPVPPSALTRVDPSAPWAQFPIHGRPFTVDAVSTPRSGPVRVAFIADLDFRPAGFGRGVLELVKSFDPHFSVAGGDLTYLSISGAPEPRRDYARSLEQAIDGILGPNHRFLAAFGNHEAENRGLAFERMPEYPEDPTFGEVLLQRMMRQGLSQACVGHVGGDYACSIEGILLLSSGIAATDEQNRIPVRRSQHEEMLRQSMQTYAPLARWRLCSWHSVARALNTGDLPRSDGDDPKYEAYRICMENGGITANGHEHVYARTKALANISDDDKIEPHDAPYWFAPVLQDSQITRPELVVLAKGSGMQFVNGLGGQDLRPVGQGKTGKERWWAKTRVAAPGAWHRQDARESGALLCEFGKAPTSAGSKEAFVKLYELPLEVSEKITDLTSQSGHCEFKTVAGELVDSFDLLNINEVEEVPPLVTAKVAQPHSPAIQLLSTKDPSSQTLAQQKLLHRLAGHHGSSILSVGPSEDAAAPPTAAVGQNDVQLEGQWTSMQIFVGWICLSAILFAVVVAAGRIYAARNRSKNQ